MAILKLKRKEIKVAEPGIEPTSVHLYFFASERPKVADCAQRDFLI
jgi:hypothetical protein